MDALSAVLLEHGPTLVTHTGTLKARPEVAMLATIAGLYVRMLTEFGLTPGARSKVETVEPESGDRGKQFFAGKR